MTNLRKERLSIPAVDVWKLSTLPLLYDAFPSARPIYKTKTDEDDGLFTDFKWVRGAFPYRAQDLYSREFTLDGLDTVVLENDYLKATFVPSLGGRLWSLYDKVEKKDLMFNNPVFRPAWLGLRNAWFSGGTEWNLGWFGHHPRTCDDIFTAVLKDEDGTPILRFYDFERVQQITFQIDFSLPEGSKYLYCRVRLVNPTDRTQGAYWWSNIAIKTEKGARVITHADKVFVEEHGKATIVSKPMPKYDGKEDVSYPENNPTSIDHFFKTEDGIIRYITHVNPDGYGLVQASTQFLKGRKLFTWGNGEGGKNFQQFLSGAGCDGKYCEIQAGVCNTQMESMPMPPKTAWEWLEVYGAMHADKEKAFSDWHTAQQAAEDFLTSDGITVEFLEKKLKETKKIAMTPADEIIHKGHSFAALEELRRKTQGETPLSRHLDWGEVDFETEEWAQLLSKGKLPCHSSEKTVVPSWMVQDEWIEMLERSTEENAPDRENWYAWLLMGCAHIMQHDGYLKRAEEELLRSAELLENPWAYYALAELYRKTKRADESIAFALKASALYPEDQSLTVAVAKLIFAQERYEELASFTNNVRDEFKELGRIRFYNAYALAELGDLAKAEEIFSDEEFAIPDMREDEVTTSELWFRVQESKAKRNGETFDRETAYPPIHIDFDMRRPPKKE